MKAVEEHPNTSFNVLDQYRTQEMCERADERNEYALKNVPDQYKSKEMSERATEN